MAASARRCSRGLVLQGGRQLSSMPLQVSTSASPKAGAVPLTASHAQRGESGGCFELARKLWAVSLHVVTRRDDPALGDLMLTAREMG